MLGAELCRGRGAGGKPEVGALAAQETRAQIEQHLQNVDLAFVVFGAGGGTGLVRALKSVISQESSDV